MAPPTVVPAQEASQEDSRPNAHQDECKRQAQEDQLDQHGAAKQRGRVIKIGNDTWWRRRKPAEWLSAWRSTWWSSRGAWRTWRSSLWTRRRLPNHISVFCSHVERSNATATDTRRRRRESAKALVGMKKISTAANRLGGPGLLLDRLHIKSPMAWVPGHAASAALPLRLSGGKCRFHALPFHFRLEPASGLGRMLFGDAQERQRLTRLSFKHQSA